MDSTSQHEATTRLAGRHIALVGKLAAFPKRDARQLIRQHGGAVCELDDGRIDMIVVGEDGLPLNGHGELDKALADAAHREGSSPTVEVIVETELWERLGLVDSQPSVRRLYTPAMLAGLLNVPVAVIRRWQRRRLIEPVHEVRRLPYFDYSQVSSARRLAELVAAGVSPASIERQLAALARLLPGARRPLVQLSVIVEGKDLLLRQGDGLVDSAGQRRFDFEAHATDSAGSDAREIVRPPMTLETSQDLHSPEELVCLAGELEDAGQLAGAAATYRTALAAGGPHAPTCFLLAELLYRLGDLGAARERYYMAIELDEDFVEARANLGCVLAETGQAEMAVAAFEGTLALHPEYADVHYHLARTLDELSRREEAEPHWRQFLDLAPDSPWAEEARIRLGETVTDRSAQEPR